MNDAYRKIINILKRNLGDEYSAHEKQILAEMEFFKEHDIFNNILKLYNHVIENPHTKGNENKVNSFVMYGLGVTSKKPDVSMGIQLDKRRTYGRDGFPDIDMDFDYKRRPEIINYLIDKYGRDKVGNIGIIQTLKVKAAVRRTIKVLDPTNTIHFNEEGKQINKEANENFRLENEILNTLPKPALMKKPNGEWIETVADACKQFSEFRKYMEKYPKVCEIATKIQGRIAGYGAHAAGVVISDVPLETICPLHQTVSVRSHDDDAGKNDKVIATQFSMYDVEAQGLIKFDVLGLSTKTALHYATQLVKDRHGVEVDLTHLPLNDKPTLDVLNSGKTDGLFQLEERGMQQTLQQIGIHSFDDLVIAVAMYRPGPKDYIPELSNRKRGSVSVSYVHPLMENITKVTYGIMVYQEQLMKVFMSLGDLSASEGYSFIKGCSKKKRELIEAPKERFFNGAAKKGISQAVTQKIWADMEKFGGYAFNKSHACCYAYESYKTAYLKAHYPLEFMAARLSVENERRKFDKVEKYEYDATHNLGINIQEPHLNESKLEYAIVGEDTLRRPLLIKGIGTKAAEEIVAHQPYKGSDILLSFATKVGPVVNTRVMEAMHDSGLWSGYKKSKLLSDFEQIKKDRKKSKGRMTGDLFG